MMISGQIKDFSIPEALKVISEGKKSGLLSIRAINSLSGKSTKYYISVLEGSVNGFCENLDGRDLLVWLSEQDTLLPNEKRKQVLRLKHDSVGQNSLGNYLVENNFLNQQQLQYIFNDHVVQSVQNLFLIDSGLLVFLERAKLPEIGLTGLDLSISNLIIQGLHKLQDWSFYLNKLPEPQVALLSFNPFLAKDSEYLNSLELRLLRTADGKSSLSQLSSLWNVGIQDLQKAAFGLVITGLVEEMPIANTRPTLEMGSIAPARLTSPAPDSAHLRPKMATDIVSAAAKTYNLQPATSSPSLLGSNSSSAGNSPTPQISNAFLEKFKNFMNNRLGSNVKSV